MLKLDLWLQLEVLDLDRNSLSGTLPSSWVSLTQASHFVKLYTSSKWLLSLRYVLASPSYAH